MNFDYELQYVAKRLDFLHEEIKSVHEELTSLISAFTYALDFTSGFLECCEKHGIKIVAIQRQTKLIPESVGFVFGADGSVFASEREGDWPAIWAAVEEYGISGGAGNGGQHQISRTAQEKLIDGVYQLIDCKWERVDKEEHEYRRQA